MKNLVASVVIPAFNSQGNLDRCLEALAGQSLDQEKFEIIVVDNGSSPPLQASDVQPRHVKVLNEREPGSYSARNRGIHAAQGDIVAFTDSDCVPERNWLQNGVEAMARLAGPAAVGGNIEMFVPPGKPRTPAALYELCFGFRQERNLKHRGFIVTANLFIPRAVIELVGFFRTDVFSGGDVEWCARARQRNVSLGYAPDAIVYHPVRSDWRALRSKVLRVAAGVSDAKYRTAIRGRRSAKGTLFSKLAGIDRVVRSRVLKTWGERVAVFLMALLVSVWGVEGRIRSRLRRESPR